MKGFRWPDARGWIGVGCYSLTILVFVLIAADKKLLESDAFLILATAVVITGWNGGPVGWAYQATKGGGEQAESTARIAERAAGVAPPPRDAATAARMTADAADEQANRIEGASA